MYRQQGSHRDFKTGETWKSVEHFSVREKSGNFDKDWKSQGILPETLEKYGK